MSLDNDNQRESVVEDWENMQAKEQQARGPETLADWTRWTWMKVGE